MPKKQTRKRKYLTIVLVLCVISLFLLSTLIAIIFTQGGKITRNGIINTGSAKLEISPQSIDAEVLLDGKKVKVENDFINNIEPGDHSLRIESPDFHVWEKIVTIRPSLVSNIEVKLFPLDPELLQLTQTDIDQVFFSVDGSYAYYLVNSPLISGSEQGFWRIRLEDQDIFFKRDAVPEKLTELSAELYTILSGNSFVVNPDSNNRQLIIYTEDHSEQYLIDLGQNGSRIVITDLNELLGFVPTYVNWFNSNNSLIVANETILLELNLTNQEKTVITYSPSDKLIFSANNTAIYFHSTSDNTLSTYQNKQSKKLKLSPNILPEKVSNIWLSQDSNSLVLESESSFYLFDLTSQKILQLISDVSYIDMSFNGRTVLFSNDTKLITITIDKIIAQDQLAIKTNSLPIDPTYEPRFINNSNLLVFNNKLEGKLQVAEDDGTNVVDVLDNSEIVNGYFHFQKSGISLVVLLSNGDSENVLKQNLYKLSLNQGDFPFKL